MARRSIAHRYNLAAVVAHEGTLSQGHYTAYVRGVDDVRLAFLFNLLPSIALTLDSRSSTPSTTKKSGGSGSPKSSPPKPTCSSILASSPLPDAHESYLSHAISSFSPALRLFRIGSFSKPPHLSPSHSFRPSIAFLTTVLDAYYASILALFMYPHCPPSRLVSFIVRSIPFALSLHRARFSRSCGVSRVNLRAL